MRVAFILALMVAAAAPGLASAQQGSVSTLALSRPVLREGQTQTLTVVARDLAGEPLAGAQVVATVRYGAFARRYTLPKTDRQGRSALTFAPPHVTLGATANVAVMITNGFMSVDLTGRFLLQPAGSPPAPAHPSTNPLVLVVRTIPASVTPPQPVWIIVYAHSRTGVELTGARVDGTVAFKEGAAHFTGRTDADGVATIRVETASVHARESVKVSLTAQWKTWRAAGATGFAVQQAGSSAPPRPAPTPVPTPASAPTAMPSLPPSPTPTPVPTWTPLPTATEAGYPPTQATPTATLVPTATLLPTWTPLPTPTSLPTNTPVIPTDTPSPTATPTSTSTPTPGCPGTQSGCMQAMLGILNQTRAQYGLQPLQLNMTQSQGTSNCVGAYGHSVHMAQMGQISHDQFPADICVSYTASGENVGEWSSGNEAVDLQRMNDQMMTEPHDPGTCAGIVNHACNILSRKYAAVGIGIYYNNTTWLTEDFIG